MTPKMDPKLTAEMQACVGSALLVLAKALRQMRTRRVPLDDEVYRRASWARMSLVDLQTALRYSNAESTNSSNAEWPGLFEGTGDA